MSLTGATAYVQVAIPHHPDPASHRPSAKGALPVSDGKRFATEVWQAHAERGRLGVTVVHDKAGKQG